MFLSFSTTHGGNLRTLAKLLGGIGLLISVAAFSASGGALVAQVSTYTNLQQYASNKISFDAVSYDDLGFFNPAQPTRLTIPQGVNRAKFTFSAEVSFSTTPDYVGIGVHKNGTTPGGTPGMGVQTTVQNFQNNNPQIMGSTVWIPVQPGDYFELSVGVGVAGKHTSDFTWLAVEAQ